MRRRGSKELHFGTVSDAQASRIGRKLFYDIHCKRNYCRAFPYLLQAANAGYVHSQNLVGYCYSKGVGVARDPKQAFYWFHAAATNCYEEAPFNLALTYEKGEGTPVNLAKAFAYYKKAAELGNPAAQCNLGVADIHGLGTRR